MRCHGFAGAAPSGVEVDHGGAIALEVPVFGVVLIVENVREEVFVGDFFCFHCVDVEWSLNRDYLFSIGNHCKSKQRVRYKQISKGNNSNPLRYGDEIGDFRGGKGLIGEKCAEDGMSRSSVRAQIGRFRFNPGQLREKNRRIRTGDTKESRPFRAKGAA